MNDQFAQNLYNYGKLVVNVSTESTVASVEIRGSAYDLPFVASITKSDALALYNNCSLLTYKETVAKLKSIPFALPERKFRISFTTAGASGLTQVSDVWAADRELAKIKFSEGRDMMKFGKGIKPSGSVLIWYVRPI